MTTEINWYTDPQFVQDKITALTAAEAAYAFREGWYKVLGYYPSNRSLAVLLAKSGLETGRWKKIHNYNFGNIKKKRKPDDGHTFTMFPCSEILKGKEVFFKPPHIQTHFAAYPTTPAGAEGYIRFVSQKDQYKKAWQKVIEGDPSGYCHELKLAGYYTANEVKYTENVVCMFSEFMNKMTTLLAWKPEEIDNRDTDPAPPPDHLDTDPAPPLINIDPLDIDKKYNTPQDIEQTTIKPKKNVPILIAASGIIGFILYIFQSCQ